MSKNQTLKSLESIHEEFDEYSKPEEKSMVNKCCDPEFNPFCEYKSIRFLRVRDRKLVITYNGIMLCILIYIMIYTVWIDKGYQDFELPIGSTYAKVKGTASDSYGKVYDAVDIDTVYPYNVLAYTIVEPESEKDALFIATSFVATLNQTRTTCDGNSDVRSCTSDSDCPENYYNPGSQGILTGVCGTNNYCQVSSWCPLENDSNPDYFYNVDNFTILIQVEVRFPKFGFSRTNTYDKNNDGKPILGYNLFTIDDIIRHADKQVEDYEQVAEKGMIIMMTSNWNCNLDKGRSKCNPNWNFVRIDNKSDTISTGYNFRSVGYNPLGTSRSLVKTYGIRILFRITGIAGEFSLAALGITIGSGIAYLAVAALITDIVLENFLKESENYKKKKNKFVENEFLNSNLRMSLHTDTSKRLTEKKLRQVDIDLSTYTRLQDHPSFVNKNSSKMNVNN